MESDAGETGNHVTREEITAALKEIGVQCGDTVMFHSSLSSMGWVVGGADTVIEGFLAAVGTQRHRCRTDPLPHAGRRATSDLRALEHCNVAFLRGPYHRGPSPPARRRAQRPWDSFRVGYRPTSTGTDGGSRRLGPARRAVGSARLCAGKPLAEVL